jgi:hypothetical protein
MSQLAPRGFDPSTLPDQEGNSSLCCVVTAPAQPFFFRSGNGVVEDGTIRCGGLAGGWKKYARRSHLGGPCCTGCREPGRRSRVWEHELDL